MPASDIGYVTFAFAADGSKLYAINESPTLLNKATGNVNSLLDGVYVSNTGCRAGPWIEDRRLPEARQLRLGAQAAVGGKGYGPGVQAWYNQFLTGRPDEPEPRLRRPRRGLRDLRTAARTGTPSRRTGTSTSPAGA